MNLDVSHYPPETQQFLANLLQPKADILGGQPTFKGHIQQLIIPLDTAIPNAVNNGEYELPGHRFWVDAKTTGQAQVFFDDPNAQLSGIPCVPGTLLKMPIETVYITAPAQPGLVLVVNFGDFDVIPPVSPGPVVLATYGAAFKSNTTQGANVPENIIASASNLNGFIVYNAQYFTEGPGGNYSMLSKLGAVAPSSPIDGDILLLGQQVAGAISNSANAVLTPIRFGAGRRLDRITTGAETLAMAGVLYTLVAPN